METPSSRKETNQIYDNHSRAKQEGVIEEVPQWASLMVQWVKDPPAMQETQDTWV